MGKSSKKKSPKSAASKPMTKTDTAAIVIPLECTEQEYQELTSQVAQLTVEEAQEELLECARYGEVDAVRALLEKFPDIVNTIEQESGNTALHKASANGHVSTTRLLLQKGASLQTNQSGNTPLHWAAASGHTRVIQVLLQESPWNEDVDVLQKNDFGRSILTEGFSSQCTEVVKLLLEHDSATEEKLLAGGQEVNADVDEDNDVEAESNDTTMKKKKMMATITHDFTLNDTHQKPLRIRELQIAHADNPFGQEAVEDTTGYGIWCASLVMARWMASTEMQQSFHSKTILELGAGCGLPGLAAAHYSYASKVYVTDLNPTTVENLQYNVNLNFGDKTHQQQDKRVICTTIDWNDESTWPKEKMDYVIGSDLIYQEFIVPLLKKVVLGLLKPSTGRFLYVAPDTGRDGLDDFIESIKNEGCILLNAKEAPESYHANPLTSGDEEDCFLHFNELASSTYMLYEFRVASTGTL